MWNDCYWNITWFQWPRGWKTNITVSHNNENRLIGIVNYPISFSNKVCTMACIDSGISCLPFGVQTNNDNPNIPIITQTSCTIIPPYDVTSTDIWCYLIIIGV